MADDKKPQQPTPTVPTGGGDPANQAAHARTARGAITGTAGDMVKVTVAHTAPLGLPPMTVDRARHLGLPDQRQDFADRQLTVGENTIPAAHWNAVKDQSPVRNWIEEGLLYEGADRNAQAPLTGQTFRESLSTLSDDDARRYVEASSDTAQLARWSETERRPAVRDAIQRRQDALGAGK